MIRHLVQIFALTQNSWTLRWILSQFQLYLGDCSYFKREPFLLYKQNETHCILDSVQFGNIRR